MFVSLIWNVSSPLNMENIGDQVLKIGLLTPTHLVAVTTPNIFKLCLWGGFMYKIIHTNTIMMYLTHSSLFVPIFLLSVSLINNLNTTGNPPFPPPPPLSHLGKFYFCFFGHLLCNPFFLTSSYLPVIFSYFTFKSAKDEDFAWITKFQTNYIFQ